MSIVSIPILRSLVYSIASSLPEHPQPRLFWCELLCDRMAWQRIADALSGSSLSCVLQKTIIFVIICRHMVTFSHTPCGVQVRLSTVPRLLRFTLNVFDSGWQCSDQSYPSLVVACLLITQLPTHVYLYGRQRPCMAAHDMEQPSERIETVTQDPCRDAHLLPHLCGLDLPFQRP